MKQEESELGQPSSSSCISMTLNDDIELTLVGFLIGKATPVQCLVRKGPSVMLGF